MEGRGEIQRKRHGLKELDHGETFPGSNTLFS